MNLLRLHYCLVIGLSLLLCASATAQTTVTIGTGNSSSSTRGPFQRSDTNSSTVFSRFVQTYTASELASAGIPMGASITALNWELASSNVIIGSGDATVKIYVKNSSATEAIADTWTNLITGSSLVVDNSYNTTNNFPGSNGWMPFSFSAPFIYNGGALEIAVDWDGSQISTPAFSGDGSLKWRWTSTAPDTLVAKKTSSSSPSSTISDLKDERANIQIEYSLFACAPPTSLFANNVSATGADLNWAAAMNAVAYNWKVVAAGAGVGSPAVDAGTTASTTAATSGLTALTSYDFFVATDCGTDSSGYAGPYTFLTLPDSQTIVTIGTGNSSSSTRGPFQRSDTNSSTVFSRFVHVYTASELAAAGITPGVPLTALNWELASSNVMIGSGDATLKVYIKNSSATEATADSWTNLITGSSLVVDNSYNTTNNFPGANGWMPFAFTAPFVYTGDALEIAVDWDCSLVSTPAFSGDGSLKWRWESTDPDTLVVKKTSSSSPSSTISDLKNERANIQFAYATPICEEPTGLTVANITETSVDISWTDSSATGYNWRIVLEGAGVTATAADSGSTTMPMATSTALMEVTSYDLYVNADCGGVVASDYAGPFTFKTACATDPGIAITTSITNVSCFGENDGAVDLTVTAGTPGFGFSWSNADTTEDVSGLAAGSYSVTVTDGNGCPIMETVEITEPMILEASATSIPDTANAGLGSVSVMATGGTPPYSFAWDGMPGSADSTGIAAGTYEVVVTDVNGCVDTVSVLVDDIVGISFVDYITNLSISPNPTQGVSHIEMDLSEVAEVSISIYSIRGERIEEVVHENVRQLRHQVNLSAYADGIYFIRLAINQQAIMKKIILQK